MILDNGALCHCPRRQRQGVRYALDPIDFDYRNPGRPEGQKRDAQHASLHCHDYTPGRGSSLNSPRLPQACYRRPLRRGVGSGAIFLFSVHCLAHGNLGEHQRTLALDCFQQHFGSDLPLRPLMRRFRQLLNVSPGILRTGSEGRVVRPTGIARAGDIPPNPCMRRVSMPWKNQGGGPWGSDPKGPSGSGPRARHA